MLMVSNFSKLLRKQLPEHLADEVSGRDTASGVGVGFEIYLKTVNTHNPLYLLAPRQNEGGWCWGSWALGGYGVCGCCGCYGGGGYACS